MNEPVVWLGDGSPHSPRFNDRYRSRSLKSRSQSSCPRHHPPAAGVSPRHWE